MNVSIDSSRLYSLYFIYIRCERLTSGAGGVLLDGLTLLDESVLGGGETALHCGPESGSAQLGGEAWGATEDLSLGGHFFFRISWSCSWS